MTLREALPAGKLHGFVQHARQIGILVGGAGRRLVRECLRRDEIAPPQLGRVHFQFGRGLVNQALDGVGDVGPSRATIGGDRRGVGERHAKGRVERRYAVDARHAGSGVADVARRPRPEVGAHVVHPVEPHAEEPAFTVEGERAVDDVGAAVGIGRETLRARGNPLHRLARVLRSEHECSVLGVGGRALAETAAHVLRDEMKPLLRHAGIDRQAFPERGDALHARVKGVGIVARVVRRRAAARLHGIRRNARHLDLQTSDVCGPGERSLDGSRVACVEFDRQVARSGFMQLRRAGRQRFLRVNRRGKIAIPDLDQFRRVLRRGKRFRRHQRDRFADKAHLAVRQHRPLRRARLHPVLSRGRQLVHLPDVAGTHRVLAGVDALHARMPARRIDVDRHDLRVRAVGTQEVSVELARKIPVGGVLAAARGEARIFNAPDRVVMSVRGTHVKYMILFTF